MKQLKILSATALLLAAAGAYAQQQVVIVTSFPKELTETYKKAFEAKNPGVKIEMQFLENEAYKAKAPTLLQSKDRPHIIYSWAGGVLKMLT